MFFLFSLVFIIGVLVFLFTLANRPVYKNGVPQDINNNTNSIQNPLQSKFNTGVLLLGLGPLVAGIGLFFLLWNNVADWWLVIGFGWQFSIVLTLLAGLYTGGIVLLEMGEKSVSRLVLGKSLLLLGIFVFGGALILLTREYPNLPNSKGEMFAIWMAGILPVAYLTRSAWVLAINTLVGLTWLWYASTKISWTYTQVSDACKSLSCPSYSVNGWFSFVLLSGFAIILTLLYAWHQNQRHDLAVSATVKQGDVEHTQTSFRYFYIWVGLLAFLTIGTTIAIGATVNEPGMWVINTANTRENFEISLRNSLFSGLATLLFFGIDFLFKKRSGYNVSYTAAFSVFLASVAGVITVFLTGNNLQSVQDMLFYPFYLLLVPFTMWLMADYLRYKSPLSGILFYVLNIPLLLYLSTDGSRVWLFTLFELIVILSIMGWAAIVHAQKKRFAGYVWTAIILSLLFRIYRALENNDNKLFWILLFGGLAITGVGVFLTRVKTRKIEGKTHQVEDISS